MGGLDARYAIARLGLEGRVASLVTIGTPHRGTPLADLGTRKLRGRLGLGKGLGGVGGGPTAFYGLTTPPPAGVHPKVRGAPRVWYASVVGWAPFRGTHPLLWPAHRYLSRVSGPNDGVVPLAAQAWGEVLAEIEADHWAQIGWSRHFDAAALFEELMR